MSITHARRLGVPLAGVLLVAGAGAGSAHVTVSSPDASAGGYSKLIFRVPTESDTASTTSVSVTLPSETPFPSVRTLPLPGWDAEIEIADLEKPVDVGDVTLSEAPASVTWTATGDAGIGPDEFAEFPLSVGPLPDEAGATLEFPAVQTYSGGEVVAWDQSAADGAEPDRPAPALTLGESAGHGGDTEQAGADAAPVASTEADDSGDTLARTLGGAGLVLGGAALGLVLAGRRGSTS